MDIQTEDSPIASTSIAFRARRQRTYRAYGVRNSNRSRGHRARIQAHRIINLQPARDFNAQPLMSITLVRDLFGEGDELERGDSPRVLRAWRSKYVPHVGKKQQAKLARRLAARAA